MIFENKEERKAYNQSIRILGIHGSLYHASRTEIVHRKHFYRKCSLEQATLKGYASKVDLKYKAIHRKGLTVDHIVPLRGVDQDNTHIVCGLNVPWNLRGETLEKNQKKANLFVDNADAIAIILKPA